MLLYLHNLLSPPKSRWSLGYSRLMKVLSVSPLYWLIVSGYIPIIYICVYTYYVWYKKGFIIGIGSLDYGGWEVPWPAICKLENQESWWYNWVQVWMSKNQEHWCLRAGEDGCLSSCRESEFAPPLPFCSIRDFNGLDDAHLHWWGWSLLSLLIQMIISSRDTLIDTPRN